jgi:hypothetical protein
MGCIISRSAGAKKKKKAVIKVIKKKAPKEDRKTPMSTTEFGGGDQEGDRSNQSTGQLTAAEAFDSYAQRSAELDKHRLTRQDNHLQESDLANLEGGAAMPADETQVSEETLPATLPDQVPTKPGDAQSGDLGDLAPARGSHAPAQQDGDGHDELPDGQGNQGDEDENQSKPLVDNEAGGDKMHAEAWNSSWGNHEPWSWEQWNTYGKWGSSSWSGDYWTGDGYNRAGSFDSQRSDMTSPEWISKVWDRMDSQDQTPHKDRQSFRVRLCLNMSVPAHVIQDAQH